MSKLKQQGLPACLSADTAGQAGIAHLLVVVAIAALGGLILAQTTQVTQQFPHPDQQILGRGSEDGDSSDDDDDDANTPTTSPASTTTPVGGVVATPKPTSSIRVRTNDRPEKQKTEIRFGEGEKIKTRVEEDRTRIDVYSGGVKVRYEIRDGRVTVKAETEEGEGVAEGDLFKIEERLGKTGIKVATEGGKLLLERNNVGALAHFPLQIDLNTNQLVASTSAGTRVLTVLPDQAVANILAVNVISRLGSPLIRQAVETGQLSSVTDVVALGERNGVPVYEILGLRDHLLLGFIPVSTSVTVFVSAENGQVVAQEQSLLANIVNLFSP